MANPPKTTTSTDAGLKGNSGIGINAMGGIDKAGPEKSPKARP